MRRMRHIKSREVQGCTLSLDASIASSLYDATSGGALVAADAAVARWEDQSASGHNATNATSGLRPLRRIKSISGVDALEFDGTDDALVFGSTSLLQNAPYGMLHAVHVADTSAGNALLAISGFTGVTRAFIGFDVGPVAFCGGRRLDADSFDFAIAPGNSSTGTVYAYTAIFDYANASLFIRENGLEVASNLAFHSAGSTSNSNAIQSSVGAGVSGTTEQYDGKIGEVAVFTIALSSAVVRRYEDSRMRKWRASA